MAALLAEAVAETPHYNDAFKAHETARLNPVFIRTLIALDPWHVVVVQEGNELAGVSVTVPDFGTLWSLWIYVKPRYRTKDNALAMVRVSIRHYQNHRFHKVACYVRPDNRVSLLILKRVGFAQTAVLKEHLFGHDVVLMERPFTKAIYGYDRGMSLPFLTRLKLRLAAKLGL